MHFTRIKICGVMRPEDAALAAGLGAHAVGMIFHPASRRCISPATAREIVIAAGPFVVPVGVFVDAPSAIILQTVERAGLGLVQLHGSESVEQVAVLAARGLRMFKALRVDNTLKSQLDQWRQVMGNTAIAQSLAGIVLETAAELPGGTGIANDWELVARHQAAGDFAGLPPVIAAGGLNPGNVAAVIKRIAPYAVDVSSGVEEAPGRKSADKVKAFVTMARSAYL